MTHPIIIVGTGLAGYQLAREFRKINTTAPLMLITEDDGRFYSKPLLSTAFTQKKNSETLTTATAENMAIQLKADIKTHTQVTAIHPENKTIQCNDKTFSYQTLILATGATVIKAPLKGDAVNEVASINHLYHYSTFQSFIQHKKHITLLGAGLIGCEFANDLSNVGYDVHVIAPVKAPLDLLVPESIGLLLKAALETNGVTFHLNCIAESIHKTTHGYSLSLSNGETLETDFVLSAIGLTPHLALAKTASIQCNRGILVNRYLETSVKDIYALGDCAEVEGHVLPFITPLLNCAKALAKTLNQEKTPVDYPAMPVTVKTPAHPIVVCPPPKGKEGQWIIEHANTSVKALFYDRNQTLWGFVLTNDACKEKLLLSKQIPPLF